MPREPPVRSDNQHALLALAGGSREDAPGTDTIRDQVFLKKKKYSTHKQVGKESPTEKLGMCHSGSSSDLALEGEEENRCLCKSAGRWVSWLGRTM